MIEFPAWVTTTPCLTRTFSEVYKTRHGAVTHYRTMSTRFTLKLARDQYGLYYRPGLLKHPIR